MGNPIKNIKDSNVNPYKTFTNTNDAFTKGFEKGQAMTGKQDDDTPLEHSTNTKHPHPHSGEQKLEGSFRNEQNEELNVFYTPGQDAEYG